MKRNDQCVTLNKMYTKLKVGVVIQGGVGLSESWR